MVDAELLRLLRHIQGHHYREATVWQDLWFQRRALWAVLLLIKVDWSVLLHSAVSGHLLLLLLLPVTEAATTSPRMLQVPLDRVLRGLCVW